MERTEVERELEDSKAVRGGGVPGEVVLMASRLDRKTLSCLISGFATIDGLGRPVSSSRNVFERFSSFSRGAPGRFLSFWQINNPRRRLGRAGSSPAKKIRSCSHYRRDTVYSLRIQSHWFQRACSTKYNIKTFTVNF